MKSSILLFLFLFINSLRIVAQDSVYIENTISNYENSSSKDFVLVLKRNGKIYDVYKVINSDFSSEFSLKYSYHNGKFDYDCYIIYNLASGSSQAILYDKLTRKFYLSDVFDLRALGDELRHDTVDFCAGKVKVICRENETPQSYTINLKEISPILRM